MVVSFTGEELYKSSYGSLYRKKPSDTKQRYVYHQVPRLCENESNYVESRNHPGYIGTRKYARPVGLASDYPICLGLGSYVKESTQNTDKDIVRMPPPQDMILTTELPKDFSTNAAKQRCPRQRETLQDVITKLRWISTIKRETIGNFLPVPKWKIPNTTLEENSDMVRDRTKRYETSAGDWQKVSTAWNRVQYRPNSSDLQETNSTKNERKTAKDEDDLWRQRRKTIKDLIKGDHISIAEQCKSRKLPGYGGFVPREPVESNFDPYSREIFRSSTNRAYRPFPHDVMHDSLTMSNHCRAPLSRLVTLAHPCNPFKGRPSNTYNYVKPIYH